MTSLDDLAHRLEVEAEVLRAVSHMSANDACQFLLDLVLKIRRSRDPAAAVSSGDADADHGETHGDRVRRGQDRARGSGTPIGRPKNPDLTPDVLDRARAKIDAGDSLRKVAADLLVPPSTLHRTLTSKMNGANAREAPEVAPDPLGGAAPKRSAVILELVGSGRATNMVELGPLVAEAMGETDNIQQSKNRTGSSVWQLVNRKLPALLRDEETDRLSLPQRDR